MRVAFNRLTSSHKVLLFALVDVDNNPVAQQRNDLISLAANLAPADDDTDFERLLRELSEGFVRLSQVRGDAKRTYEQVQWIHPSCRDLAIEELGRSRQFRRKFLEHCSVPGVEVAISVGGGATGDRSLPLLQATDDWQRLVLRCVALVPRNPELLSTFLSTIELLRDGTTIDTKIGPLTDAAAATLHAYASGIDYWQTRNLKPFLELRRILAIKQAIPSLRSFFEDECNSLAKEMEDENISVTQSASTASTFAQFCTVLTQSAPDEAQFLFNSQPFERLARALEKRGDIEANCSYIRTGWSADALTTESEDYVELAEGFRTFASLEILGKRPLADLNDYAWRFESEAEDLVEEAAKKNPQPDYDEQADDPEPQSSADPPAESLERIFDDL